MTGWFRYLVKRDLFSVRYATPLPHCLYLTIKTFSLKNRYMSQGTFLEILKISQRILMAIFFNTSPPALPLTPQPPGVGSFEKP